MAKQNPVSEGFQKAKSWYESKTIIGVIITLIGTVMTAVKPEWSIDLAGVTAIVMEDGEKIAKEADVAYASIIQIIGLATAAWGRIKAKVPIK